MLRKEKDELQILKNKVKDLAREVDMLKKQERSYNNKFSVINSDAGKNNFKLDDVVNHTLFYGAPGATVKPQAQSKNIFNQIIKYIYSSSNNTSQVKGSFTKTKDQSQYQQIENFRSI